jgi:hypothetical protein
MCLHPAGNPSADSKARLRKHAGRHQGAVTRSATARQANHFRKSEYCFARFVQPFLQKYSPSNFCKSELYRLVSRLDKRGGSRLSRTRGGMRWPRACCETGSALAGGQAVGAWHPDAGVKFAGRQSRRRRWLTSPAHRGDHGVTVKPSRGECRVFPVYSW